MDTRKKVLILYASAGHGHEKAAQALYEAFREKGLAEDVKILDALSLTLPLVKSFYRWIYFTQIKYFPWLWGWFYHASDNRWTYFFIRYVRRLLNGPLGFPFHGFLIRENPSVIVTTHFLSTEVASYLKGRGKISSRLVTVVTDYLPHYVWTAPYVDFYAVAAEETKKGLIERGVAEEKVCVTGIPIEKKFLEAHSRAILLDKFGLAEGRFTVLITGGGAGMGPVAEITARLTRLSVPLQILLVCGTNQALYARMKTLAQSALQLKVFGFVDNMQELMEVCDLVIGKGGGLTLSESFAKGKPLVLFRSVPGQEKRNDAIAERHSAAFATDSLEQVVKKVSELALNPAQADRMREGVKQLARPDATQKIVSLVLDER